MKEDPEKRKAIKKVQTLEQVVAQLFSNSRWGCKIYPFLLGRGYQPEQDEREEKKSLRALNGQDFATMALLLYHRQAVYDEPFTVRSLAKAMDNSDDNARKAQERQVMRLLKATAGYQLIDFYRAQHKGHRECIHVVPDDALIDFLENDFFND